MKKTHGDIIILHMRWTDRITERVALEVGAPLKNVHLC